MVLHRILTIVAALAMAGCVTAAGLGSSRDVSGSDDAAAATAILNTLRAEGVPAEPASDERSVFVYQRGMATLLSPIVQSEGLDRIVATRRYAPAAGAGDQDLRDLAGALNDTLNVGVFSVEEGVLVFQSQMTFVDRLQGRELVAFLGWLDAVELAIARVDGSPASLLLTE